MCSGANRLVKENTLDSLFFQACRFGYLSIAQKLISNGVKCPNTDDWTMKHLEAAVEGGHGDIVLLLISNGIRVSAVNNNKDVNLLYIAAKKGFHGIFNQLTDAGASLGRFGRGNDALRIAIIQKHDEIVQRLFETSANDLVMAVNENRDVNSLYYIGSVEHENKATWRVYRDWNTKMVNKQMKYERSKAQGVKKKYVARYEKKRARWQEERNKRRERYWQELTKLCKVVKKMESYDAKMYKKYEELKKREIVPTALKDSDIPERLLEETNPETRVKILENFRRLGSQFLDELKTRRVVYYQECSRRFQWRLSQRNHDQQAGEDFLRQHYLLNEVERQAISHVIVERHAKVKAKKQNFDGFDVQWLVENRHSNKNALQYLLKTYKRLNAEMQRDWKSSDISRLEIQQKQEKMKGRAMLARLFVLVQKGHIGLEQNLKEQLNDTNAKFV